MDLPDSDLIALAHQLVQQGWRDRSLVPEVRDLEGQDGHAVVMVPRTGRIQIRVHYLTPHEERSAAAESTRGRLLLCLGG